MLKTASETWLITYKGPLIKLLADFSLGTTEAMDYIFKVLREKPVNQEVLYPAKLSSRIKKKLTFQDKQKLIEYITRYAFKK